MSNGVFETTDPGTAGVSGISDNHTANAGPGVLGQSDASGVWGISKTWHGVTGQSESTTGGAGVFGGSDVGPGVIGESKVWMAIYGKSHSTTGGAGVSGENVGTGPGVIGSSKGWHGTYGSSESTVGGAGVCGEHKGSGAGVVGQSATGAGIFAKGNPAGSFEGDVVITGNLKVHGMPLGPEQIQQLGQQVTSLQSQVTGLQQQLTTWHQLVTNLQSQLAILQSKEAADVQGIEVALATLAARVTSVGG